MDVLREGGDNNDVFQANMYLYQNGYLSYNEYGYSYSAYTGFTTKAVRKFQTDVGIIPTGNIDCETWKAMGYNLNSTLQEEFNLPSKIVGDYFTVFVCKNTITINYNPYVYFRGAPHTVWDWGAGARSRPVVKTVYASVSKEEQEKYLNLFKNGISEIFTHLTKDADVLGVNPTIQINVNPTIVSSASEANVIINVTSGRSNVSYSGLFGWSVKNSGTMNLYTKYFDGVDKGKDRSDEKFKATAAHEFAHQVLGLDDAYMDDTSKEGKKLYLSAPEVDINYSLMRHSSPGYVITGNDVEMILLAYSTNRMQSYRLRNLSDAFYR